MLASLSLLSTKIIINHHHALDVILKTLVKYLFLIAVDIFQLSLASLSLLGTGLAIIVFAALGCCGALASSRLLTNLATIFTIIINSNDDQIHQNTKYVAVLPSQLTPAACRLYKLSETIVGMAFFATFKMLAKLWEIVSIKNEKVADSLQDTIVIAPVLKALTGTFLSFCSVIFIS